MWNWFLPTCFPKHQTALLQKWIWWEKVLVISLSRILQWRGRELRNLKSLLMKIGDESILFFSRVFLSKFSLKALFLSWVKGVFILGWEWNVKCQVFQNRAGLWLGLVAWLRCEFQPWGNWTASCPILSCSASAGMMLQLMAAWHTCSFWWLAATSHPWDPVASPCFSCILLSISSHYLTHYPYKNAT